MHTTITLGAIVAFWCQVFSKRVAFAGNSSYLTDAQNFYTLHLSSESGLDSELLTDWNNVYWASNLLLANLTGTAAYHDAIQVRCTPKWKRIAELSDRACIAYVPRCKLRSCLQALCAVLMFRLPPLECLKDEVKK